MKKLFVLGSFLAIFLFILGCQSEAPVTPVAPALTSEISTLQKPSPGFDVQFYEVYSTLGRCVVGSWGKYGGAKGFRVFYLKDGTWTQDGSTYAPVHHGYTLHSITQVNDWAPGTYTFRLEALNKKGVTIGAWAQDVVIPPAG